MKNVDKFKWTAVGAAASVLVATVVLAFVAPLYLISLWLGFAAGYISIRSLVLYAKEKEREEIAAMETPVELKKEEEVKPEPEAVPMDIPAKKVEEEPKKEKATTRKKKATK